MGWQEFKARARKIEENFAKNLKDPVWATANRICMSIGMCKGLWMVSF